MDNRDLLQEITQLINSSAKETREYVDTAVNGLRDEVGVALADQTNQLLAVIESSLHPIKIIAEGHEILCGKVDELSAKTDRIEQKTVQLEVGLAALRTEMRAGDEKLRIEMRAGDVALREELVSFRAEVRGEFAEVRRVARVESAVSELSTRVGRLEKRAGA